MRHQHVVAVAARTEHADETRLEAELFVAAPAHLAFAAADPWIDQAAVAGLDVASVGAGRYHLADGLVSHDERQGETALGELELLATAEVVGAFPEMQIAVAD